jgi:environmental stress-induced protein Ves
VTLRHLTQADYRAMPWANGRGVTTELAREDRSGTLSWRLSLAAVVEDGPFSVLPGVLRNLTVISGPGFDLVGGGLVLNAAPLCPVAFDGGLAVSAVGVAAPSEDFNVMVEAGRGPPDVRLLDPGDAVVDEGCLLALFAFDAGATLAIGDGTQALGRRDLLIGASSARVVAGRVLAVRISSV